MPAKNVSAVPGDALSRASVSGRGVIFFRPAEAAAFLGISREEITLAMREYVVSRGRRGLAHFSAGKGSMIRRASIILWCLQREQEMVGK